MVDPYEETYGSYGMIGGYNCTCNEVFSGKGVDREMITAEGNDILVRKPGYVKDREGKRYKSIYLSR